MKNTYFCSFASGNLSMSTNAGLIIFGTVGRCDLIVGDKCYVVTTEGRMFHDKITDIKIDSAELVFAEVGVKPVKSLAFIGRDDD